MAFEVETTTLRTRGTLQDIIDISVASGLAVVPSYSVPATFEIDFCLPPPPPIYHTLLAMGIMPDLAEQLSDSYLKVASRLRQASQVKWRNTVYTCVQINQRFGIMSYDSRPLGASALSVYLKTLREMEARVTSACGRRLHRNAFNLIPKSLSGMGSTSFLYRKYAEVSTAKQIGSGCYSPDVPHLPFLSFAKRCNFSSSVVPLRSDAREDETALIQPVVHRQESPHEDPLLRGYPASAFPRRYTHRQPDAANLLPSSSKDFLLADSMKTSASLIRAEPILPHLLFDKFTNMSINTSKSGGGDSTSFRSTLRKPSFNHILQPSLCAPATSSTAQASRRRLAPMPKRTSLHAASDHISSLSPPLPGRRTPESFETPVTTTMPFTPRHAPPNSSLSVLPSPGATSHPMPMSNTRRRKMISLPHRRPTSASTLPSSVTLDAIPRLPSTISRAPSMMSLTSTSSDSSSPSDDDLDTPPSSPLLRSQDPSELDCKVEASRAFVDPEFLSHASAFRHENMPCAIVTSPQAEESYLGNPDVVVKREPDAF